MTRGVTRLVVCTALAVLTATFVAFAGQGATSISGVVVDSAGGVVPGATVIVTNAAGTKFETVSNTEGIFSVPAIAAGAYTVEVSLAGFKAYRTDVRVQPGLPAALNVTLELGSLTETVTVMSSSELINTQTATVAATLNADQLLRMPTPTRNAINAVTFLPGVNTLGTNRNSTINGLPESMMSVTLDGVSNNDNFNRSTDGFFATVYPRQDAVEAASVVMAVGGASVGGSGAVNINFTTRSGTDRFAGTTYEYYRNPALNSNYFFNELNGLEKNDIILHQYGLRASGPIVIPGLYNGRGKAFYMFHYESVRFPNSFTRTRTALHPRALDGWFRYDVGGQTREINVLALAAANGQVSARDPLVMSLLNNIQSSMGTTGTPRASSDPLLTDYVWLSPGLLIEHQPTVRIDYNLSERHRLSGSSSILWAKRDPDYLNGGDVRFPGATNYSLFSRMSPIHTGTLRSTLTRNIVSELRVGITSKGGTSYFGQASSNGPQSFDDQRSHAFDFDANIGLTNWHVQNTPSWRSAPTYSLDELLTWQKGAHSITMGGSYLLNTVRDSAQQMVPSLNLGFDTQRDPAAGLFTTANFAGASAGQLTDARELYAMLTGRVTSLGAQIALDPVSNQYVLLGPRTRQGRIEMYSAFLQDTWRVTPTVTLTGGFRWDAQLPFSPDNDIMSRVTMADMCGMSGVGPGTTAYNKCNFFAQGPQPGAKTPEFLQLTKGTQGYNTDWNNVAPTASIAWRPNVESGWLRSLLGDPEQATLRGGYSVAYERQGMAEFTGTFGGNPGSTVSITRSATSGVPIVGPGEPWPVFVSETNRLYTPPFNPTPSFPIAPLVNRGSDANGFAPDVKIGSAHTWNVGLQRSLTRDTAIEIRYLGTKGVDQWSELDYNEIRGENLISNGFLDEFRRGMQNLQANNASGVAARAGSFAYFGPGTGTNPLPIYLAYLNGSRDAANPAAYTGGANTWTNTTFAQRFAQGSPSPINSAGDLDGNTARRNNAVAAGLPDNFLVLNPTFDEVTVYDSGAFSDYNALQIELRRRLSRGLSYNINYQFAREGGSAFDGFSFGRVMATTTGGAPLHAIKSQWDWNVPVGKEQRFGSSLHPVLEAVVGGWSINAVSRTQQRLINFGNVRLVGMTKDDLQDMYKFELRINPSTGLPTVYNLPDDVILNTRRAYSVGTTTLNGYSEGLGPPQGRYIAPANRADCLQIRAGDCAPRETIIRSPWFSRVDLGVTKKFPLGGLRNIEIRLDLLNAFDNINFTPVANPGTGATIFQVTAAYSDASNTYDPGGRLGQLMVRFNW
jgi:Carboxypeptidase regulatory-like domain